MVTKIPYIYQSVADETIDAFCDCQDDSRGERNLTYRAFRTVPADVAVKIMALACPHGYNEFKADVLAKVKGNILLAREYSVCIYVTPGAVAEHELGEDEYNIVDGRLRIWWD